MNANDIPDLEDHHHHDPLRDDHSHLIQAHDYHDHGHDAHHEHAHYDGMGAVIYGTPTLDASYWRHQGTPFTCGLNAQIQIYECITGEHVPEIVGAVEAAQSGWLTTHGTVPENMTRWLEYKGFECHSNENGTLLDIIKELRDGNKVIVGVNSDALWSANDATQAFHTQAADHAIWLTGVDVSDPDHVKVVINDSGKLDGAGNVYDLHDLENVLTQDGIHYAATGHGPSHLPEHPAGYDEERGVFSSLDAFLHDHAIALVGVAATGALAVIHLNGLSSGRSAPAESKSRQSFKATWPPCHASGPSLAGEFPSPAPTPLPLQDLTRDERDRLLRDI